MNVKGGGFLTFEEIKNNERKQEEKNKDTENKETKKKFFERHKIERAARATISERDKKRKENGAEQWNYENG